MTTERLAGNADTEGETPPKADPGARLKRQRRAGLVTIFPREPGGAMRAHPVNQRCVAGRGNGAEIDLADPKASRKHAELEPGNDGLVVLDCGSRNGTYVNGTPVNSAPVTAPFGAVLRLANTLLLVVDDIEFHSARPRCLSAAEIGNASDALAGPILASVWDAACRAADADHPILVTGESGSGKEIISRLVHRVRYANRPFVALNLAAIPEGLFESELFGHERGAFTGALRKRAGAFSEAADGVLFLDEIGELRPELQVKLLRALDTNRVRPLGANSDVGVHARVVAATNRNLRQQVSNGAFREDLFYRLASIELHVPPLRERKDDIVLLASSILAGEGLRLSTDAAEALALAPWRGNVRNLRRVVAAASMKVVEGRRTVVEAGDLPDLAPVEADPLVPGTLTADALRLAVTRAGGVIQRAARNLGIARSSFYEECKRLGVNPKDLRRK